MPIAIFCASITSIAVHPSVPANNVKELIAHVKANAGKVSYGSAGTGTMSHLSGELFKAKTGLNDVVHIPYKGAGPGMADLVSGHIPMMSPNISGQVLEFHKTGKIRILAINAKERLKAAPDIPTAIEQGVPDMIGQLFLGIFAPAATPKPAIDALSAANRKAVDNPEFEKILTASGLRNRVVLHGGFGAEIHGRGVHALEAAGRQHRAEDELIRTPRRPPPAPARAFCSAARSTLLVDASGNSSTNQTKRGCW